MDGTTDRARGLLLGACAAALRSHTVADGRGSPEQERPGDDDAWSPAGIRLLTASSGSIVEYRGFDGADQTARLVDAVRRKPEDFTVAERFVAGMVLDGAPWHEASKVLAGTAEATEADSMVRVLPAAILTFSDPGYRSWLVERLVTITHPSDDAVRPAAAAADIAAAWIASDEEPPPIAEADVADQDLPAHDPVVGAVADSSGFVDAVEQVREHAPGGHRRVMIAGGLAGARWGASAIPAAWLHPLEERHELAQHADRLLELAGEFSRQRQRLRG